MRGYPDRSGCWFRRAWLRRILPRPRFRRDHCSNCRDQCRGKRLLDIEVAEFGVRGVRNAFRKAGPTPSDSGGIWLCAAGRRHRRGERLGMASVVRTQHLGSAAEPLHRARSSPVSRWPPAGRGANGVNRSSAPLPLRLRFRFCTRDVSRAFCPGPLRISAVRETVPAPISAAAKRSG
ncbi:MAG: hypothetical protein RL077_5200 [Verrucomicrobiota bacterium]